MNPLRGTVFLVYEDETGYNYERRIIQIEYCVSAEEFKDRASEAIGRQFEPGTPTRYEFGPIGPPWGIGGFHATEEGQQSEGD